MLFNALMHAHQTNLKTIMPQHMFTFVHHAHFHAKHAHLPLFAIHVYITWI